MKRFTFAACLVILCAFLVGCPAEPENKPSVDGSKFLLTTEPDGAQEVIAAREAAADGDDVLVVGRIGGAEDPWTENRAAFTIVDNSLKACSDIPGDQCPIPWDYCCERDKLPEAKALIKVVDENGDLVKADARDLLNVKELSTVIVQGKAQKDEAGNLTILADGIYVKNQEASDES